MIPEPHVCIKCRQEIVWTDCFPAICYKCREKEREAKADAPTIVKHRIGEQAPDELAQAQHAGDTSVYLQFADGHTATIDLARLGINVSELRMTSVRVSSSGSAVQVENRRRKTIDIDSAVLRSFCDPRYAAELRQAKLRTGE